MGKIAKEVAWLHRTDGVELINLADENPTVNKAIWRELCEAIIAENIDITIFQPDSAARHGMNWFTRMGKRVLLHEGLGCVFKPAVTL